MSHYVKSVHDTLHQTMQEKWGWVIYRTTYKDDGAWERFRNSVNTSSRETLRKQGASPLVLGSLDCIFVSDPVLEGASRDQLLARFRQWRKLAIQAENPQRALPKQWDEIPGRYVYFVEVDEDSLNSVVQASRQGRDTGWVHFVRCDQEVDLVTPPQWPEDDSWKMLASRIVAADFYDDVWTYINRWDVMGTIDELMETEAWRMEKAAATASPKETRSTP